MRPKPACRQAGEHQKDLKKEKGKRKKEIGGLNEDK
jgi:hypothetical protein